MKIKERVKAVIDKIPERKKASPRKKCYREVTLTNALTESVLKKYVSGMSLRNIKRSVKKKSGKEKGLSLTYDQIKEIISEYKNEKTA